VVKLEKFENLERMVNRLVKQFSLLKRERDEIASVLEVKSGENKETKNRLEKFSRERHLIRSKLDVLIDKLESMERTG
jgi:septal ring factor EnvC (AmiA/AmiB activator)